MLKTLLLAHFVICTESRSKANIAHGKWRLSHAFRAASEHKERLAEFDLLKSRNIFILGQKQPERR